MNKWDFEEMVLSEETKRAILEEFKKGYVNGETDEEIDNDININWGTSYFLMLRQIMETIKI